MKINFSRWVGESLSYFVEILEGCGGREGGGGISSLHLWKIQGGGVKSPKWWGMDIFWNHTL